MGLFTSRGESGFVVGRISLDGVNESTTALDCTDCDGAVGFFDPEHPIKNTAAIAVANQAIDFGSFNLAPRISSGRLNT